MRPITAVFLLLSNGIFAQIAKPTVFDKFISKSSIEWAAYNNDMIRFEHPQLNLLLLKRFQENQIKGTLSYNWDPQNFSSFKYMKMHEIDDRLFRPHGNGTMYDSLGNEIRTVPKPFQLDTASFVKTDVTQVLFIENGRLRTYIPYVSPTFPIITSFGIYLGDANYFSTCFNFTYNLSMPSSKNMISLGQFKKIIRLDSATMEEKLKELYGRNLLQTLWPHILSRKIDVFNMAKGIKIHPDSLNTDLLGESIPVKVYDEYGNASGQKAPAYPIDPKIFTAIELEQDWYYDQTNNKVFSIIRSANLYTMKWDIKKQDRDEQPILKLILK